MSEQTSGGRTPIWMNDTPPFVTHPLNQDLAVDICIIGGGIAGLTTAYYALEENLTVALLEDGDIASGESGRTSAHLASALDDHFYVLEQLHGSEGARRAAESHAFAIDEIERISREDGILCNFRRVPGYLFRDSDSAADQLAKEFDAARRAGLHVTWTDRAPFTNFDTKRCLVFANQAQFHPLRYLTGLAGVVRDNGGHIFTGTHAQSIHGGEPARVTTANGRQITAGAVVVATNSPIVDKVAVHTKQASYRSYVIAVEIGKGSIPHALYWDTDEPYHYIRVIEHPNDENSELLLIGGEDEKTGQTEHGDRAFDELEKWGRLRFPTMGQVKARWSGQVIEPLDGLGFIGKDPGGMENVYIVTGDSGNGLTQGTLAARLNIDLIVGRKNSWAEVYDPSRKMLRSLSHYVQENLNSAAQYADHLTAGDVKDLAQLARGKGAIIRRGVKKVAVYRDMRGDLHEFSAVCPHLGAVVGWNDQEKTWDCPAHGSRFTCEGRVVNGPANSNLTEIETEAPTHQV